MGPALGKTSSWPRRMPCKLPGVQQHRRGSQSCPPEAGLMALTCAASAASRICACGCRLPSGLKVTVLGSWYEMAPPLYCSPVSTCSPKPGFNRRFVQITPGKPSIAVILLSVKTGSTNLPLKQHMAVMWLFCSRDDTCSIAYWEESSRHSRNSPVACQPCHLGQGEGQNSHSHSCHRAGQLRRRLQGSGQGSAGALGRGWPLGQPQIAAPGRSWIAAAAAAAARRASGPIRGTAAMLTSFRMCKCGCLIFLPCCRSHVRYRALE